MYKKLVLTGIFFSCAHVAALQLDPRLAALATSLDGLTQVVKEFNMRQAGLVMVGTVTACSAAPHLFDKSQKPLENAPVYKQPWFIPTCSLIGGIGLIIASKYIT